MQTDKTCQLRIYATDVGYDRIDVLMRQCCHLINASLQERIDCYQKTGQSISLYEQRPSLTEIRMDADWNASINILNRGLATLPGGKAPGAVVIVE